MKNRIRYFIGQGTLIAGFISVTFAATARAADTERFQISGIKCFASTSGSSGILAGAYVNLDGSLIPNKMILASYETCTKLSMMARASFACGQSITADLILEEVSKPGRAVDIKNVAVTECAKGEK